VPQQDLWGATEMEPAAGSWLTEPEIIEIGEAGCGRFFSQNPRVS